MYTTSSHFSVSSCRKRVIAWLLLTSVCLSFAPSVSMAQQPTATITALSGEVLVSGQAATVGAVLSAGDSLQTQAGASVVLELSGGSEIRIGENTEISLRELTQTVSGARISLLSLLAGRLRALLSPAHQHEGSAFTVETPNAQIGAKFSQPDIEVSYDPAKQETVGIAHTVALVATNLLTGETKIVPVGSTVIISGLTIKIIAGIVGAAGSSGSTSSGAISSEAGTSGTGSPATGTSGAGTTATETAGTGAAAAGTTAGISTGTLVAIGVGVAAVGGGAAVAASSSGDEGEEDVDVDGSIDWDNPFTGTFKFEGGITLNDPDNTPANAIFIYYLIQQGNSVTGSEDATITSCCTFTDTATATGRVDGNTMILITTVTSSTTCTCPDGREWNDPLGISWTHTCTLLDDGSGFQFENGMVFLRQ